MKDILGELEAAAVKLRETTGDTYASAEVSVVSTQYTPEQPEIKREYRVYTSKTQSHCAETLDQVMQSAVAEMQPEALRRKAEALRAQAFDLQQQAERLSTPVVA